MNDQIEIPFQATIQTTIRRRTACLMREGMPISIMAPQAVANEAKEIAESAKSAI